MRLMNQWIHLAHSWRLSCLMESEPTKSKGKLEKDLKDCHPSGKSKVLKLTRLFAVVNMWEKDTQGRGRVEGGSWGGRGSFGESRP